MSQSFNGTVFRLPIRTAEAAKESQLSKEHYTNVQMRKYLDQFGKEAAEMLLFLNHVNQIQIYYREDIDSPIVQLADVHITSKSTLPHRKLVYQLEQLEKIQKGESNFDIYELLIRQQISQRDPTFAKWLVTRCTRFRELNEEEVQYDPTATVQWVGIAAPLHDGVPELFGRVYCCLPLPIETGYPVHINGNFALSSNRRFVTSFFKVKKNEDILLILINLLLQEIFGTKKEILFTVLQNSNFYGIRNCVQNCYHRFTQDYSRHCKPRSQTPRRFIPIGLSKPRAVFSHNTSKRILCPQLPKMKKFDYSGRP
jgi:hypothetical protein